MEDSTLYKIVAAIFMGLMIMYLWPRVKRSMTNSPKAEPKEWQTFLFLMLGVVAFVLLMIAIL